MSPWRTGKPYLSFATGFAIHGLPRLVGSVTGRQPFDAYLRPRNSDPIRAGELRIGHGIQDGQHPVGERREHKLLASATMAKGERREACSEGAGVGAALAAEHEIRRGRQQQVVGFATTRSIRKLDVNSAQSSAVQGDVLWMGRDLRAPGRNIDQTVGERRRICRVWGSFLRCAANAGEAMARRGNERRAAKRKYRVRRRDARDVADGFKGRPGGGDEMLLLKPPRGEMELEVEVRYM